MKICILVPAIIDLDSFVLHCNSLANIFSINEHLSFKYILHVDACKRKGDAGTIEDFSHLVQEGKKRFLNVSFEIHHPSTRAGLSRSMSFLFTKFLESDCDLSVVIEDDSEVSNPLYLDHLRDAILRKDVIHRLSFGVDGKTESRTIEPEICLDNFSYAGRHVIYENNRNFCSQNGTFLTREIASDILESGLDIYKEPENEIATVPSYANKRVRTIFSNKGINVPTSDWPVLKESHILLDRNRIDKRVGYDAGPGTLLRF
jgi:hypothetical protein